MTIPWDTETESKFYQMIKKIPPFMRGIAQEQVFQKAQAIGQNEGHSVLTEKDLVDAFFAATPFGFHGPMKSDMESIGIDYKKYGHE